MATAIIKFLLRGAAVAAVVGFASPACSTDSGPASADDRDNIGKADLTGSCRDSDGEPVCGGPGSGSCWCDDMCATFGDCCTDAPGACGVGFRGECTVTDEGVMTGCPDLQPCILTNCDPGCEPLSGDCCEGVCEDTIPDPVVVECTVTDEGVFLGCGDGEICMLTECDDACGLVSAECCDAQCVPFVDDAPDVQECTVTDEGVSLGCDSDEICILSDCEESCTPVSASCCEGQCVPFMDGPTAVECIVEDNISLGCDEGEICVELGSCVEDCTDGPEACCTNTCAPL